MGNETRFSILASCYLSLMFQFNVSFFFFIFQKQARNGPPAPPNSGSSSASSSGISGGSVGGLNSVSPGMGDLLSPGGSAVGGDTQASAGELIVLACMVCSYGLIGAGLLHTILVMC
jgi:hypothetical protein